MLGLTDDRFRLAPNILIQKIEELGKYWVFDVETGEHYSLNETSFWILDRLAGEAEQSDVLGEFLSEFDVSEEEGRADFAEVIKGFLEDGILQRR
jgi:hypothetical protein